MKVFKLIYHFKISKGILIFIFSLLFFACSNENQIVQDFDSNSSTLESNLELREIDLVDNFDKTLKIN